MARRFVQSTTRPLASPSSATATGARTSPATSSSGRSSSSPACASATPSRAAAFSARVPGAPVFTDLDDVLATPTIDAVVVATPPRTHHAIVRAALEAGKHVLVEKPLATTAAEARDLIEIADATQPLADAGPHVPLQPAGQQGQGAHRRRRARRGLLRHVVAHEPRQVPVRRRHLRPRAARPVDPAVLARAADRRGRRVRRAASSSTGVPETAFLTLTFASGATANVQISWLAPRKVREMIVVGSQRMVQYDDTAADEAVRVYDRGMEFSHPESFGEHQLTYRTGDIVDPASGRRRAAERSSSRTSPTRSGPGRPALAARSSASRSCSPSRPRRSRCAATARRSRSRACRCGSPPDPPRLSGRTLPAAQRTRIVRRTIRVAPAVSRTLTRNVSTCLTRGRLTRSTKVCVLSRNVADRRTSNRPLRARLTFTRA